MYTAGVQKATGWLKWVPLSRRELDDGEDFHFSLAAVGDRPTPLPRGPPRTQTPIFCTTVGFCCRPILSSRRYCFIRSTTTTFYSTGPASAHCLLLAVAAAAAATERSLHQSQGLRTTNFTSPRNHEPVRPCFPWPPRPFRRGRCRSASTEKPSECPLRSRQRRRYSCRRHSASFVFQH